MIPPEWRFWTEATSPSQMRSHSRVSSSSQITKLSLKYRDRWRGPRIFGRACSIHQETPYGTALLRAGFCRTLVSYCSVSLDTAQSLTSSHCFEGSHKRRDNRCSIASVKLEEGTLCCFPFPYSAASLTYSFVRIYPIPPYPWLGSTNTTRRSRKYSWATFRVSLSDTWETDWKYSTST